MDLSRRKFIKGLGGLLGIVGLGGLLPRQEPQESEPEAEPEVQEQAMQEMAYVRHGNATASWWSMEPVTHTAYYNRFIGTISLSQWPQG